MHCIISGVESHSTLHTLFMSQVNMRSAQKVHIPSGGPPTPVRSSESLQLLSDSTRVSSIPSGSSHSAPSIAPLLPPSSASSTVFLQLTPNASPPPQQSPSGSIPTRGPQVVSSLPRPPSKPALLPLAQSSFAIGVGTGAGEGSAGAECRAVGPVHFRSHSATSNMALAPQSKPRSDSATSSTADSLVQPLFRLELVNLNGEEAALNEARDWAPSCDSPPPTGQKLDLKSEVPQQQQQSSSSSNQGLSSPSAKPSGKPKPLMIPSANQLALPTNGLIAASSNAYSFIRQHPRNISECSDDSSTETACNSLSGSSVFLAAPAPSPSPTTDRRVTWTENLPAAVRAAPICGYPLQPAAVPVFLRGKRRSGSLMITSNRNECVCLFFFSSSGPIRPPPRSWCPIPSLSNNSLIASNFAQTQCGLQLYGRLYMIKNFFFSRRRFLC